MLRDDKTFTLLRRRLEGSIEKYLRETGGVNWLWIVTSGGLLLVMLNLWDYSNCFVQLVSHSDLPLRVFE
jgi:hypothetical protein